MRSPNVIASDRRERSNLMRLLRRFAPRNDIFQLSLLSIMLFNPAALFSCEELKSLGHLENRVIVVDAGHGTINFENKITNAGKETFDRVPEHKLTIQIAEKLGQCLETVGATVYMTRTKLDYWRPAYNSVDDNRSRAALANAVKADILISVHCDWHPNRRMQGVTTLYSKKISTKLGRSVHNNLIKELKARDRSFVWDRFTILDNADMPAVIVEAGFMSNREEGGKLKTPSYQLSVAKGITKGLLKGFNP